METKKVRKIWSRGKRTDTGTWVYGMPLFDWADCSLKCENQHNGELLTFLGWSDERHEYQEFEVDPSTVGMSTGMTTSYDVEIFEGDVCNFTAFAPDGSDMQFRGVVVYDGSRYMIWKSPEEECFGFYGGFDLDWVLAQDDELAVIGNVHDAPQLLQQK